MSRTKKLIRNLVLFFAAAALILLLTGYHLSSRAAFRDLEEAAQFGKGEIVFQKQHDGSVYFLSISGDWAAMGVVEKTLFFSKGFPPLHQLFRLSGESGAPVLLAQLQRKIDGSGMGSGSRQ